MSRANTNVQRELRRLQVTFDAGRRRPDDVQFAHVVDLADRGQVVQVLLFDLQTEQILANVVRVEPVDLAEHQRLLAVLSLHVVHVDHFEALDRIQIDALHADRQYGRVLQGGLQADVVDHEVLPREIRSVIRGVSESSLESCVCTFAEIEFCTHIVEVELRLHIQRLLDQELKGGLEGFDFVCGHFVGDRADESDRELGTEC